MTDPETDVFAPHLKRNLLCLGGDISLFICGINFSAWSTILPVFIRHFSSSNIVLGLLPTVRSLGQNVPPILVSPYVEGLRRYKPFILFATVFERLPYLVLCLATLGLGTSHPDALLAILFGCQLVISIGSGVTTPAWLHLVSLMIPTRLRGRFFGISSATGGVLAVGSAALTVEILRRYAFPQNFAICFLATFIFLVFSNVLLASTHEPRARTHESRPAARTIISYLRSLPSFLRRERNFSAFLTASVLGNILMAIAPFLTAAASHVLHVSDAQVGAFTVVLLAASTVGSLCWGWLGDHAGYRVVLIGANAAGLCTALLALVALARNNGNIFYGVFALLGLYNSATQLASFTIVTEFGTRDERPTFIALSSLVLAPVAVCAPMICGVIADAFGYNVIFLVAAVSLGAAILLYTFAVRDPRASVDDEG